MKAGKFKFDKLEFSGSLGDLGTLIPLSVALILVSGLSVTSVFLIAGLLYICTGLYFRLPIPVQPLKVMAAIAIASPEQVTAQVISASGMIFGIFLLILATTGLINWLASLFSKPVVRGIQLGLGLILVNKGIGFISSDYLFINNIITFEEIPVNLIIGICAVLLTLLLLSSKRFPAALVLVGAGVLTGILFGALQDVPLKAGPAQVDLIFPGKEDFLTGFFLLVIPQIPLTIGNAIIGTRDTCISLFGENDLTEKATYKAFTYSMGIINVLGSIIGGMPVCHGAGGLAAHYRFGARTGGSNIMIGIVFIVLALAFGQIGISLLSAIPNAVLGTLLLFAGLELAMLILDVRVKKDLFVSLLIAGISLATTNMGIAFFVGIIVYKIIQWREIKI